MSQNEIIPKGSSLDTLLFNLESLKGVSELSEVVTSYLEGDYKPILRNPTSQSLFSKLSETISRPRAEQDAAPQSLNSSTQTSAILIFVSGLAAFNTFLQANVTGPPLDLSGVFSTSTALREQCLKSLEVDGVSVYQHIPHVELFCFARLVFTVFFPRLVQAEFLDCKWMRLRINTYHQRLLSGVSYGRLVDSSLLQNVIERDLEGLENEVFAKDGGFGTEARVQFLLEKAQIHIMQGQDFKAKEDVRMAREASGFNYALSGALGKRTKFQQNDLSQLLVFAKSRESNESSTESLLGAFKDSTLSAEDRKGPEALDLNDDTLLETIKYTSDKVENSALPPELADLQPDQQPQLNPLDQITLLTEATIKDTYSPLDKLNSEEILPYAVRVLTDKPTNWQIYTQALLVRSRIESHRSRTQERSVLQLQVIVDQIIADTQESPSSDENGIPEIRVTQFLPRAKASESAPVPERLRYIYQLSSPTRWEIETELAFAWSSAGSLVSALEIFKRLKMWAEVALCYHSVGQEDKARQVVRRQLYHSSKGPEMDVYDIDADAIATESWTGEIRTPPPAHAPRLWCILGDLEADPSCWERAWEISNHRFARAQRTLGEFYSKKGELEKAREAYMLATIVNRQNNETWSRLGDIDLATGNWDGAIVAFQQSIMIDDTDAKTYSNLGSALLSKYSELLSLQKLSSSTVETSTQEEEEEVKEILDRQETPKDILRQALAAFKRGASIAHDNWKIWDNVITIAGRMTPPSFPSLLLGLRNVIRIRAPSAGEAAIDIDVLRALVGEVISREREKAKDEADTDTDSGTGNNAGIYEPPRGSLARAVTQMMETDIVPLITARAELWTLQEKLALYRRDYAGALACAERAWRLGTKGEEWLRGVEGWRAVVAVTDNLVSAYENYGTMEKNGGEGGGDGEVVLVEKSWRMKARSAVRGVMGRARDSWEGTEEWGTLEGLLDGLKS
ncbi:TPR repeat-containing protein [Lachnellula willkommii]|uniref:TPR repeat-containing protein n=1 Tax=Lachnellula willkommii TaxID=215461 RepID=A0A559M0V4_9HELO|nr:TPR repeat-containing protein [Lachnellula willkommii]